MTSQLLVSGLTVNKNDVISIHTGSGSGVGGDPRERDPAAVELEQLVVVGVQRHAVRNAREPGHGPRDRTAQRRLGRADEAYALRPDDLHAVRHDPRDAATLHALFLAHRGQPDRQWCIAQALSHLGQANDMESELYARHAGEGLIQPKAAVDALGWRRLLVHPDDEALTSDILAVIVSAVLFVAPGGENNSSCALEGRVISTSPSASSSSKKTGRRSQR